MTDYIPNTSTAAFDIYGGGSGSSTGTYDPYPQYALDTDLIGLAAAPSGQARAYASTVTPNLALGTTVVVGALTGNLTLANPTGAGVGTRFTLLLKQDATGGRTVTWGSAFLDSDQPDPTPNATSKFEFTYDGTYWV